MKYLNNILLIVLSLFTVPAAAQHTTHTREMNMPAIHPFEIMGRHKIYIVHNSYNMAPHDYQAIFEVALDSFSMQSFLAEQALHPENGTYTFEPEVSFVLPDMLQHPKPFRASIFRGNDNKGGQMIIQNVSVRVVKIVYATHFDARLPKPNTTDFILFGNEAEQFASHYLTLQPDFDQIVQVQAPAGLMEGSNKEYVIIRSSSNSNKPWGVSGNVLTVKRMADGLAAKVVVLKQLYFEPDFTNKTDRKEEEIEVKGNAASHK